MLSTSLSLSLSLSLSGILQRESYTKERARKRWIERNTKDRKSYGTAFI